MSTASHPCRSIFNYRLKLLFDIMIMFASTREKKRKVFRVFINRTHLSKHRSIPSHDWRDLINSKGVFIVCKNMRSPTQLSLLLFPGIANYIFCMQLISQLPLNPWKFALEQFQYKQNNTNTIKAVYLSKMIFPSKISVRIRTIAQKSFSLPRVPSYFKLKQKERKIMTWKMCIYVRQTVYLFILSHSSLCVFLVFFFIFSFIYEAHFSLIHIFSPMKGYEYPKRYPFGSVERICYEYGVHLI